MVSILTQRKSTLLFILLVLLTVPAGAQTKIDSLIASVALLPDTAKIQKLNAMAIQFFLKDIGVSRQLIDKALETSLAIQYPKGEGESSRLLCAVFSRQGQFALLSEKNLVITYYKSCHAFAKNNRDRYWRNIGWVSRG